MYCANLGDRVDLIVLKGVFKILTVFILCSFVFRLNAQIDQVYVHISNVDDTPIQGATITTDAKINAVSNQFGLCKFILPRQTVALRLQINHLSFEAIDTLIRIDKIISDTIEFKLKHKAIDFPEIFIQEHVENLLQRENWTVLDMMFYEGSLLVLNLQGSKRFLSVASPKGILKHERRLKNRYNRLHQSCFGKVHLIGPRNCREISSVRDSILLASIYARSNFDKNMLPCIFADQESVLFQEWERHNKLMKLHRIDGESQASLCLQIYDKKADKSAQTIYRKIIKQYFKATQGSDPNQISGSKTENIILEGFWDGDVRRLTENNELDRLVGYYLQVESKPLSIEHFVHDNALYLVYFEKQEFIKVSDCEPKKLVKQRVSGFNWNQKNPVFTKDEITGEIYLLANDEILKMEVADNRIDFVEVADIPISWHHQREFIIHDEAGFVLCKPEALQPKHQLRRIAMND